jgi:hypothetical protein
MLKGRDHLRDKDLDGTIITKSNLRICFHMADHRKSYCKMSLIETGFKIVLR